MSVLAEKPFPSYLETESRLPLWIWWVLRVATFGVMLLTVWAIATRPEIGFAIFWSILIPILPIVFVTAPGLWRQICPMAFVNQLPRTFGLSAEKRLPIRFKNIAYFISVLAFFFLVSLRHIYFNSDPVALLTLIFTALALALIGGFVFAGRSGWCGTFCPLGPIQKAYGHAPVVVVRNGYCPKCIGCQKNCYDFNPKASFHADLSDSDPWYAGHKRFFAAGLPGFALAYFTAPDPTIVGLGTYYLYIVGWIVTALGVYMAATVFFRITDYQAAAFAVMIAILVFYWFMAEKILATIFELTGGGSEPAWADEVFLGVVIVLAGRAYFNGLRLEKEYRALDLSKSPTKAGVRLENVPLEDAGDNVVVDRASGRSFAANPGRTLLEGIESAGLAQDFGCRMGMCGADPIVVVDGGGNLSKPSDEELSTLRRIGLEGKARMACVCRPTGGPVTIDLAADPKDEFVPDNAGDEIDWGEVAGTRRVVIVGNGTSGTTAADSIRRLSASCEIDLIARESHHFYNRMAIGRLLYTRSGLEELYLMPPDWPKARRINLHLNTQVTAIDRSACEVLLGTGEKLEYDRLILATGASAFVPPAKGADLPGCFVLREAADAQSTRSWRQEMQCTRAVVLGGGVLAGC